MKLAEINRILGFFGVVLVVARDSTDETGPTWLWFERRTTYEARAKAKR